MVDRFKKFNAVTLASLNVFYMRRAWTDLTSAYSVIDDKQVLSIDRIYIPYVSKAISIYRLSRTINVAKIAAPLDQFFINAF